MFRLRRELQLNKDYRGVNKEVWQIFHRMYGGGPVIMRSELDVYSRDLSNDHVMSKRQNSKKAKKIGSASNIFAPSSKNLA